jgi:hypothetical protein
MHLKKLRRAEGGAIFFLVFRVKNHDFTPKNHIFFNFWGGGVACAPGKPPSWIRPCIVYQILVLFNLGKKSFANQSTLFF